MEPRLDVHLWGQGGSLFEEWVDATVTHPNKQDGRLKAVKESGVAVETAEQRKRTRYGIGTGGTQCAPFGSETWGRMGASAYAVIERLAGQHVDHCGASRARVLRRWLAELGVALCRAQAETVAQSARRITEAADGSESACEEEVAQAHVCAS